MKSRSFFRDAIGTFNASSFILLINIIIGIIIARSLGVYHVGLYYALLVIPNIIVQIGTLGLGPSLIFHIGKEEYHISDILKSIYTIFSFSSIFAVASLFVIFYYLDNPDYSFYYLIVLAVFIPLQFLRLINNRILLATMQIKKANNLRVIPQFINLLCLVLFFYFGRLGVLEALLSLVFSSLMINIVYYFIIFKKINFNKNNASKSCTKSLLKYGFLYALTSIVMKFNMEFDIILLERLSTFDELGLYKMGVNFARLLNQAPIAISSIIFLRAAHSKSFQKSMENSIKHFRLVFLFCLLSAVVLFFLAPVIIPLFYGMDFQFSSHIMRIILPGTVILVATSILSSQTSGSGKPLLVFFSFLPALIINIILNVLWIPKYGGVGAAWASNISYFSGALIFLSFYAIHNKISFFSIFKFSYKDINAFKEKN